MAARYSFDRRSFSFRRDRITVAAVLVRVLRFLLVTAVLAVLYYVIFALVISTDKERRLRRENRLYARVYPQMLQRQMLVDDVIEGLQLKDNSIYKDIFHADAPGINPFAEALPPLSDSISDRDLVYYTARVAEGLEAKAVRIEDNLRAVTALLSDGKAVLPPLSMPLDSVSYAQTGASIGDRINPFYKVPSRHSGLDIIAQQGDPVLASAGGTVTDVVRSRKGLGNMVEITHPGGYVTRYGHLGDILVGRGQRVSLHQKIGTVGISGSSYATHLHYEVLRDSTVLDPVHYFPASADATQYADMLYMSAYTGQSLD